MEEAGSSPSRESPSGLMEQEGDMEAGLQDVDLDSYQTTLEEVLTWLLSAEDTLQIQDEVSDDVEEVKEQFHTHEVNYQGLHLPSLSLKNKVMLVGILRVLLRSVVQSSSQWSLLSGFLSRLVVGLVPMHVCRKGLWLNVCEMQVKRWKSTLRPESNTKFICDIWATMELLLITVAY